MLIETIKSKTRKDKSFLKLRRVITNGDWGDHKKDPDIALYNLGDFVLLQQKKVNK